MLESALNHQSGVFSGIVCIYQTDDYATNRCCPSALADRVEEIIGGEPAKVVKFRR